jgi:trehalose 6-phosphate synthase
MNLVAKEYVAAQDANDPGVLILSRFAGAAVEGKRALLVNPYDAESVAAAIAQALAMPLEERCERHAALLHGILENNVDKWQSNFLDALRGEDRTADESRAATKTSILDHPGARRSGVIPNAAPQGRA